MEAKYPKLNFTTDKELDQWTCKEFLTYDPNDMFSSSILRDHPKLDLLRDMHGSIRTKKFNEYIESFYKGHLTQMQRVLKTSEGAWQNTQNSFFVLTNSLFGKRIDSGEESIYKWPDGNYVCALSIFNCNPRFIKSKKFQAYYKHEHGVIYVCIHEMLHFAFYDFIERNYEEIFKKLGDSGMWRLSEIFNDVILRTPDFIELISVKEPKIYAQSEEELIKYSQIWNESQNIASFLKKYLE